MSADALTAFERTLLRVNDEAARLTLQSPDVVRGMAKALSIALEEAARANLSYQDSRVHDIKPHALMLRLPRRRP
jgi:hypothetical protein